MHVFYGNINLHFSGINGQECNFWVIWKPKDFDENIVESEGIYFPHVREKKKKEERKVFFEVISLGARRVTRGYLWKRLFMEEFVELTTWKGSGGSPGIYQREGVIRTISQALMCDIFQDSQKAESVTLWKDVGTLEAALEVGNAGGRGMQCSQTLLPGAAFRSVQDSRGSFSTVRCSEGLAAPPRMYLELEHLGLSPTSVT